MTRFSLTIAALLAPAALAIPKSPAYGYGQSNAYGASSKVTEQPTGLPTGIPHPSGVPQSGGSLGPIGSSTAPFGFTNSTGISGPTGTGSPIGTGSLSLPSTVTVVPIPDSSAIETGVKVATGNSPIGASSGAEECGPATVTVTSANTVTVTVGAGPISSAEDSSPISASSINSAPYPIGNVTTAGPTGTGTVGTVVSLPIKSSSELPVPVYTGLPTSTAVSSTNTLAAVGGVSSSVSAHGYHHLSLHKHHSTSTSSVYAPEPSSSSTSSSSVVAPVLPVSIPSSTPSTSSVEAVPTTPISTPAYSTPSTSTTSTSAYSTPSTSTTSTFTSTPTPTPTPTSSPSTSGGDVVPRGLVYNTAALTSLFAKDTVGWCYNWDSQPGGTIPSGMNFVPMLWSTNSYHLPNWESNVNEAISNGATHILGFNEPDLGAQANMSPEEAAGAWDNMEKFGDKVKIGSPAVCNGGGETGLNWLTKFMSACSSCQIDFIAIHWYGDANEYGIDALKQHIKDTQAMAGGRPIWLTEFQPSGSVEQQADFMNTMLPYLDDKSNGVERYAYFEVDGVLASGNSLTELGSKYIA